MILSGIGFTVSLLAQTAPSGPASLLTSPFLMMIVVMGIFYFLLIMPQQKRQKQLRAMLANLKTGDKVITSGGIYGVIVGTENDAVQLRIADQVKVKVSRSAIAGLQPELKEG
jgi:preprotein translocase subunit YajC